MYAGQTLAQLAIAASTDPAGVRAELSARVERNGKSAKNARLALERMDAGASVAFPERAPKAPKAPAGTPNPNLPTVRANSAAPVRIAQKSTSSATRLSERQVWVYVRDSLRAAGHPVPRCVSTAARKGALPIRAN